MHGIRLVSAGVALLLCAAVLAISGCGCSRNAPGSGVSAASQLTSGAVVASSSVSATGAAASGSDTQNAGGSSSSGKNRGLSSSDARAIDAELSAIERELENMRLPGDSDFGGIESGLQ